MMTTEQEPMVVPAGDVRGPKQGQWTYDDYAALPDDGNRYEIIAGVLYMSPAPTWSHQDIVGAFYRHLYDYVTMAGLGGAFTSPVDVELAPGDTVQPDVVVLLYKNREKLNQHHIVGAPDLVVEVVSPGSATHDRHRKLLAYARAGVPEYWIADPFTRTVEVLELDRGDYASLGVFRGKAVLPSEIVPGFPVPVEKFFISVWSS